MLGIQGQTELLLPRIARVYRPYFFAGQGENIRVCPRIEIALDGKDIPPSALERLIVSILDGRDARNEGRVHPKILNSGRFTPDGPLHLLLEIDPTLSPAQNAEAYICFSVEGEGLLLFPLPADKRGSDRLGVPAAA
jgi:hypothetical protein